MSFKTSPDTRRCLRFAWPAAAHAEHRICWLNPCKSGGMDSFCSSTKPNGTYILLSVTKRDGRWVNGFTFVLQSWGWVFDRRQGKRGFSLVAKSTQSPYLIHSGEVPKLVWEMFVTKRETLTIGSMF